MPFKGSNRPVEVLRSESSGEGVYSHVRKKKAAAQTHGGASREVGGLTKAKKFV